jgi:hypothetical protein
VLRGDGGVPEAAMLVVWRRTKALTRH